MTAGAEGRGGWCAGRAFCAALLQLEVVKLSSVSVSFCVRALLSHFGKDHPKEGASVLRKTGCLWQ